MGQDRIKDGAVAELVLGQVQHPGREEVPLGGKISRVRRGKPENYLTPGKLSGSNSASGEGSGDFPS